MGKPSSSQRSRKSDTSLDSKSSKTNMSGTLRLPKVIVKHKKRRSRAKKKFNKLLNKLKDADSQIQTICNSAIPLDSIMLPPDRLPESIMLPPDSPANPIVLPPDSPAETIMLPPDSPPNIVIEADNFGNDTHNDFIVIDDDDDDDDVVINNSVSSPKRSARKNFANIKCSTPILQRQSLDQIILNNNVNILRKSKENVNLSKEEFNPDSFVTIDLSADSEWDRTHRTDDTVINLVNTPETPDCTVISVNETVNSINYDSDVTIIGGPENVDKKMYKFAKGIAKLNASQKGKLLQIIAENVFNGCSVSKNIKKSLTNIRKSITRATETVEDKFIKEIILGETPSRNSVGSNIYHPARTKNTASGLRMIVIDGSNVAMEHTKGREFSVKGLKICIDYFLRRGHTVKTFVPRFRCKYGKSSDPRLLDELERQGLVIYTPSREVQGRTITPYDDRYIIQCAAEFGGVIVTGDNYRDLANENAKWRDVINNRLLPFTWVDDMIMFPRDPLGRNGPTLEAFLRHPGSSKN